MVEMEKKGRWVGKGEYVCHIGSMTELRRVVFREICRFEKVKSEWVFRGGITHPGDVINWNALKNLSALSAYVYSECGYNDSILICNEFRSKGLDLTGNFEANYWN